MTFRGSLLVSMAVGTFFLIRNAISPERAAPESWPVRVVAGLVGIAILFWRWKTEARSKGKS